MVDTCTFTYGCMACTTRGLTRVQKPRRSDSYLRLVEGEASFAGLSNEIVLAGSARRYIALVVAELVAVAASDPTVVGVVGAALGHCDTSLGLSFDLRG